MISLEIDGNLPAEKTSSLDSHLERCADCREYRDDLRLGSRMLSATTPEPPDNFEWKLQMRLNRTLQEAAAGNQDLLERSGPGVLVWVRSFALSSLAGAAVIALLMIWVLPGRINLPGSSPMVGNTAALQNDAASVSQPATSSAIGADRLPLSPALSLRSGDRSRTGLLTSQNANPFVSTRSGRTATSLFNRGSGVNQDLIGRLRLENNYLKKRLDDEAAENMRLKALLAEQNIDLLSDIDTSRE
jgi:putative zinc finger protein